jgi:hypothetical protein
MQDRFQALLQVALPITNLLNNNIKNQYQYQYQKVVKNKKINLKFIIEIDFCH